MDIKLYSDKEIIGRIYLQYCEISQGLSKEKQVEILPKLLSVMHKLTVMKYHKTNYQNRLKSKMGSLSKQLRKLKNTPEQINFEENFDLIAETEAFLFQTKSCLDILVKILSPICSISFGAVYTFENKGEKIIDILNNNISFKKYEKDKIDTLIAIIKEDRDKWLTYTIDLRDKTNHEESLRNLLIEVKRLQNGDLIPMPPKLDGIDISSLLDIIYQNCIAFSQDFFTNSIPLLYPNIILIKADKTEMIKTYKDEGSAKYIKYSLGIILPKENKQC